MIPRSLASSMNGNSLSEGSNLPLSRYRNKSSLLLTLVSSFGLLVFVAIGILSTQDHIGADSPQCRPIYMYPSYARVTGFDSSHTKFASKYNLFLYREQGKDKVPTENEENILDGIPVLFIPGNAGSYKQVRSIAAEASNIFHDHKHEEQFKGRNLDFFSAHFNEDFTAFHGRTMLDQAEYLNDAIRFILSLYSNSSNPPESVLLLGHSMGGVVSRVMLTLPNYVENSVNTIISLASPHAAAPATFDGDIMRVYGATDKFWRAGFYGDESSISSRRLKNVTLISITGGLLDTTLPADYTIMNGLVPDTNGFTMYTTGIPGVWTPIDHLAIVWCDQLRKAVASTMLSIVDPSSSSRTYPLAKRMELFRRGLLSGFEDYAAQDFAIASNSTEVIVKLDKKDVVTSTGYRTMLSSQKTSIIDLTNIDPNSVFYFLSSLKPSQTIKDNSKPYLMFCEDNLGLPSRKQTIDLSLGASKDDTLEYECVNIGSDVYPVPKSTKDISEASRSSFGGDQSPFYAAQIKSDLFKKYKYILYAGPSDADSSFFATWSIDRFERQSTQVNNSILSLLLGATVELPESYSLVQNIQFNSIISSLLSYKVKFDFEKIEDMPFEPFARQWVEDPFETKWQLGLQENKKISFHGIAPYTPFKSASNPLHFQIWAPFSECPPMVFIKIDIIESLKLWVLRYRLAVVSLPVSIIVVTLILQFLSFSKTGYFPSFQEGLISFSRLMVPICLFVSVLSPLACNPGIQKLLYYVDLIAVTRPGELKDVHVNPYFLGIQEKQLWILGPIFMSVALSLVFTINFILQLISIVILQFYTVLKSTFNLFAGLKSKETKVALGKTTNGEITEKRRLAGTILLLGFVMFYIPFQFAYVVCCIVQGIVCLKAVIRSSTPIKEKEVSTRDLNFLNFNKSLFVLMLWIVPVNVPVLVVFFHNMAVRWETPFSSHHNILAILPIILTVGKNVQGFMLPQPQFPLQKKVTVFLLSYFAFFSLVYGVRHLYWLHYLFNFFCAWIFILFYEGLQKPLQ